MINPRIGSDIIEKIFEAIWPLEKDFSTLSIKES